MTTKKNWQKVELAYLNRHAKDKSVEELAERFHTTPAEVRAKLKELKLLEEAAHGREALLDLFGKAHEALYKSRWKDALALFDQVAQGTDQADLAARARQYAEVARVRLETAQADAEPEDPYLQAVFEKNRGRLEEALALCRADDRLEKDERFAYLAACCFSLRGDLAAAADCLSQAIVGRPESRRQARRDSDLSALREDPTYQSLFAEG